MLDHDDYKNGDGVKLLQNRFFCGVPKNAKVFTEGNSYRRRLEIGCILSISLMIALFQIWKHVTIGKLEMNTTQFALNVVEDVPKTVQRRSVRAPSRPSVPIASEDEEIPEDETIELTGLNYEDIPLPPPPLPQVEDESEFVPVFVPYDEPPAPIGGYRAIGQHLVYPELGRLAGVQGTVILWVLINKDGTVGDVKVSQSMGMESFDESAIKAVRSVKWKPAKQRDLPVKVWISVPIRFVLKDVS